MIINGSAYGLDSTYNAIRLAGTLSKRGGVAVSIFLVGDGVTVAMENQKTPDGYYKLDQMLIEGSKRSTMKVLADHTLVADKVLVF